MKVLFHWEYQFEYLQIENQSSVVKFVWSTYSYKVPDKFTKPIRYKLETCDSNIVIIVNNVFTPFTELIEFIKVELFQNYRELLVNYYLLKWKTIMVLSEANCTYCLQVIVTFSMYKIFEINFIHNKYIG
jgi:hypothetical protein